MTQKHLVNKYFLNIHLTYTCYNYKDNNTSLCAVTGSYSWGADNVMR